MRQGQSLEIAGLIEKIATMDYNVYGITATRSTQKRVNLAVILCTTSIHMAQMRLDTSG